MSQGELLARITGWLDDAEIKQSFASSFHGEPRTTRDIDIVIDPSAESLRRFVRSLQEADFYVDSGAALDALAERTSFNVIELATGWKVDLLVRQDRPFSRAEFDRRIRAGLLGADAYVATVEDTIIAKLEWAVAGESERQFRDVASILAVNGNTLDYVYIQRWVAALDLVDAWERVKPTDESPDR